MAKRPEESDDRVVPEGRRKAVRTAAGPQGGKAVTASKEASQLGLSIETAESPKGTGSARRRTSHRSEDAVPKSRGTNRQDARDDDGGGADDENLR